jgi:hypothetical protein
VICPCRRCKVVANDNCLAINQGHDKVASDLFITRDARAAYVQGDAVARSCLKKVARGFAAYNTALDSAR